MITDARKLRYLTAMGIDVWQQKTPSAKAQLSPSTSALTIDLSILNETPLYQDILRSLAITKDQVKLIDNTKLDIELFNWQFADVANSRYEGNTLTTPALEILMSTPALKKQLWQIISQHLL